MEALSMEILKNQTWGDVRVGDVLFNHSAMNPLRHRITRIDQARMRGYLVMERELVGSPLVRCTPTGGHRLGGELTIERDD